APCQPPQFDLIHIATTPDRLERSCLLGLRLIALDMTSALHWFSLRRGLDLPDYDVRRVFSDPARAPSCRQQLLRGAVVIYAMRVQGRRRRPPCWVQA